MWSNLLSFKQIGDFFFLSERITSCYVVHKSNRSPIVGCTIDISRLIVTDTDQQAKLFSYLMDHTEKITWNDWALGDGKVKDGGRNGIFSFPIFE